MDGTSDDSNELVEKHILASPEASLAENIPWT